MTRRRIFARAFAYGVARTFYFCGALVATPCLADETASILGDTAEGTSALAPTAASSYGSSASAYMQRQNANDAAIKSQIANMFNEKLRPSPSAVAPPVVPSAPPTVVPTVSGFTPVAPSLAAQALPETTDVAAPALLPSPLAALMACDRIIVVGQSRILADGPCEQVLAGK